MSIYLQRLFLLLSLFINHTLSIGVNYPNTAFTQKEIDDGIFYKKNFNIWMSAEEVSLFLRELSYVKKGGQKSQNMFVSSRVSPSQ